MRAHVAKAALALGMFFLVSSARADRITNLTSNNLGISGSVGTIVVSDTGTNQVTVTITMDAGFSIKLEGGDIALNGPSGLAASSASGVTGTAGLIGFTGLSFKQFFTDKNISQFGTFAFDYANIKGASNGVVSADTLTFMLTAPGLMASQFTGAAIHFCTASGAGCGPNTGFASNGPPIPVPEEVDTISMLGVSMLMIGFVRSRIRG